MAAKKVRELIYDDLGKHVVLAGPEGDRVSGQLKSFVFSEGSSLLRIGRAQMEGVDPETIIDITD